MQNHIDTLLFVVNAISTWLQNQYVVPFIPAGLCGLVGALGLFLEHYKINIPMWLIGWMFAGACVWAFFYMPHSEDYMAQSGIVMYYVWRAIGACVFSFVITFMPVVIPMLVWAIGYCIVLLFNVQRAGYFLRQLSSLTTLRVNGVMYRFANHREPRHHLGSLYFDIVRK